MVSEALPTMWHDEALPSAVLLARVMPWLHKKLPVDAPKVGTSSRRELDVVIGILLSDERRYTEAIQELRRATQLEPDLAQAHYRLAQAYQRTGQKALAAKELETFERLKGRTPPSGPPQQPH